MMPLALLREQKRCGALTAGAGHVCSELSTCASQPSAGGGSIADASLLHFTAEVRNRKSPRLKRVSSSGGRCNIVPHFVPHPLIQRIQDLEVHDARHAIKKARRSGTEADDKVLQREDQKKRRERLVAGIDRCANRFGTAHTGSKSPDLKVMQLSVVAKRHAASAA
ncbi:hypothetical protein Q7P37_001948 [Cladosporium fusiforme]